MDGRPEIGHRARSSGLPHRNYQPVVQAPPLSLVVPAYDEEVRLQETLPVMWRYLSGRFDSFELIVVDDGSQDTTAAIVQAFAHDHIGVRLISYRPNRGKGHALRLGMSEARGDLVLFSDADLATPIEEFEHLLAQLRKGCDIAIASRAATGASLRIRQPWYREFSGRCLNLLVRWLAVPGVRDTQCGFKLFRRSVVRDLCNRYREDGFGFDIEVLHIAQRLGYRVVEVPVRWMHKSGSKVRLTRDVPRMVLSLHRIRRRHKEIEVS